MDLPFVLLMLLCFAALAGALAGCRALQRGDAS